MKKLPQKILLLDTETISIDKPFIYDLGFIILELQDAGIYAPIESEHFIIDQIYNNKALFSTAYYNTKRKKYVSLLKGKKAKRVKYGYATQYLKRLVAKHDITYVTAYNSPFDKKALEFTNDYFKVQNALYGKIWFDTLKIANNLIHNTYEYRKYATENNFFNPSGLVQASAEKTYAFLTDNKGFIEDHMGLQDCLIEMEILNECVKRGADFDKHYKKMYIKSLSTQYLNIDYKGKNYTFKYDKKIVRKNGEIVLT